LGKGKGGDHVTRSFNVPKIEGQSERRQTKRNSTASHPPIGGKELKTGEGEVFSKSGNPSIYHRIGRRGKKSKKRGTGVNLVPARTITIGTLWPNRGKAS